MRLLIFIFVSLGVRMAAAQWGAPVGDVRAGLSLTADRNAVELSFENSGRDRYLLLGTIGTGYPNAVRFTLATPGDLEQNLILRVKPAVVAPSVPSPLVVPLLSGSRYVYRVPVVLLLPKTLKAGSTLRAYLDVSATASRPLVRQFGLDIFWAGSLVSNALSLDPLTPQARQPAIR